MTIAPEKTTLETGRVVAIAGPVVDVEFPRHSLPEINHAVEFDIDLDGDKVTVTGEVAQQIGEGRVRCVCMKPTDGLSVGPSCARLAGASRCPWATRCSVTCSTCSASRSTLTTSDRLRTTGRF